MSEILEANEAVSEAMDSALWQVQIGPIVGGGTNEGAVNANNAYFYLSTPDGLYGGATSIDGGGSWTALPGNQGVTIQGNGNGVLWTLTGPTGGTCKFMIGALS